MLLVLSLPSPSPTTDHSRKPVPWGLQPRLRGPCRAQQRAHGKRRAGMSAATADGLQPTPRAHPRARSDCSGASPRMLAGTCGSFLGRPRPRNGARVLGSWRGLPRGASCALGRGCGVWPGCCLGFSELSRPAGVKGPGQGESGARAGGGGAIGPQCPACLSVTRWPCAQSPTPLRSPCSSTCSGCTAALSGLRSPQRRGLLFH